MVLDLEKAQQIPDDWRLDYNFIRPHGSLEQITPAEFKAEIFS